MIKPQQYTAKLEEITQINDKYFQFQFEFIKPTNMEFLAGQYVSIRVNEAGERRSYSLINRPDINHGFELLVDIEPNGIGTQFLKNLQFGDEVNVLGPIGSFVVADSPEEASLTFIATGSGIAPFYSMIQDLLQVKGDKRNIRLHWGMRYVKDLFWENEFEQLVEAFPNFSFHPVISKPVPEWFLCKGHVTDCLKVHEHLPNSGYYLCGSTAMINEVEAFLLEKGISKDKIHYEKFY